DVTHSHNSCGILLHNITRNVFVFVRQFRPAVLMHDVGMKLLSVNGETCVNIEHDTLQRGFTVELCAGIIDKKDKSVEETAALEVLEECGYRINFKDLEPISSTRLPLNLGTLQSMFYIKVTDDMKVDGYGGGNEEEGELIQVVEVKVEDVLKSVFDDQLPRPVGWTFAIVWFCYTK
ncbi:hypothetical protein HELRODRAFT_125444, partial [Helobdella robusta]|uniref:Uridine diphosphate glucose pyrophosphatase NUDT14 n=1 Tax=Helobdella robusta TaxID=6412 RepID=T1EH60_HELRO